MKDSQATRDYLELSRVIRDGGDVNGTIIKQMIARVRERYVAGEIDLDHLEANVAAVLRAYSDA